MGFFLHVSQPKRLCQVLSPTHPPSFNKKKKLLMRSKDHEEYY
jgi:hypothetical protein